MKKQTNLVGFGLIVFTLLVYIFSTFPQTKQYSFHLLIICSVIFLSNILFRRTSQPLFIYSLFAIILLIVGVTGWFFSPLFYWLYFAAIILSFLFSPIISTLFVLILVIIFSPNIGSIDIGWDILNLFSLLCVIPLTYYARGEYLKLKENEKKILILEKEKTHYIDSADQVLANRVSKISVQLREKINDIQQLAFVDERHEKKSHKETLGKIELLSKETLDLLQKFEENTTGKKLVKNS